MMDSEGGLGLLEPITVMHLFLSAFEDVPDPRAENTRHVNGGVKMGHGAAQNWATLGLRRTRMMGGGQSAALSMFATRP